MNKRYILILGLLLANYAFGDAIRFDYCKETLLYKTQKTLGSSQSLQLCKVTVTENNVTQEVAITNSIQDTLQIPAPNGYDTFSLDVWNRTTWINAQELNETNSEVTKVVLRLYAVRSDWIFEKQ